MVGEDGPSTFDAAHTFKFVYHKVQSCFWFVSNNLLRRFCIEYVFIIVDYPQTIDWVLGIKPQLQYIENQFEKIIKVLLARRVRVGLITFPKAEVDLHVDVPSSKFVRSRLYLLFGLILNPLGKLDFLLCPLSFPLAPGHRLEVIYRNGEGVGRQQFKMT
ncbi:MAG: hypothetical protein ABSG45_02340 [Nitrososphaerales archaeon]